MRGVASDRPPSRSDRSRLARGRGADRSGVDRSAPDRAAGLTLVELLVSLSILLLILVAVLTLFERNSRLARVQTHVADLQQAVRSSQHQLVRNVRMAGRGAMPMFQVGPNPTGLEGNRYLPRGVAVEVRNNVESGARIAGAGSPEVAEGSDILTLRGVLNGPLYQLDPMGGGFGYEAASGTGFIQVPATGPSGVPQSLAALCEELLDSRGVARPTAVVLISAISDSSYAVVQARATEGCGSRPPAPSVRIAFTTGGTNGPAYLGLSPGGSFPPDLQSIAFIGILQEYRYYVREGQEDPRSGITRRHLSRARVYPGTNEPHGGAAQNLRQDLADNILDLQVALGIQNSTDASGVLTESLHDDGSDDWLFNSPADDADDLCKWNGAGDNACPNTTPNRLYYVRVTTLGRTDGADPGWIDPPIERIEDHVYNEPAVPASEDERNQRRFRRWSLTTTVDVRNLS